MLEIIPPWVIGLILGLLSGAWLISYQKVSYCPNCNSITHSYTDEYCPDCGKPTENREIQRYNWFNDVREHLERPRQDSQFFDEYDTIGTGVFYDRGEDSTEERYVLALDEYKLFFDVVGTKEDAFLEPPEVHGTIYGLEYLKKEGDSE